ncbi:hypothetical protein EVAR_78404_1 [Eumeta japonica]|uniref:Uncharacterized protein n=1 Tax=Eumeta variegata TaxID=151549 RepID=A0A4C1T4P3_EUMVA|nr:hypothetical protein EVAR_78404_1 [Eumeta japonica]
MRERAIAGNVYRLSEGVPLAFLKLPAGPADVRLPRTGAPAESAQRLVLLRPNEIERESHAAARAPRPRPAA